MSLQLRQNLKLSQQLVMTPQLQQAIKLLQLSRVELVETLQQAMLENPLLEEKQTQEDTENSQEQENTASQDFKEIDIEEDHLLQTAEWEDYLGDFSSTSRQASEYELPEENFSYESFYATKPSLESHLYWQLYLSDFSDLERQIGEIIIGNLDSNGYLAISTQEIVENHGFAWEKVQKTLERIQLFDPVGIACRSLSECLMVQLQFMELEDPVLFSIVQDHLPDLERHQFQQLSKKFNVSLEKIKDYFFQIRQLDPRPGNSFNTAQTFYISPDAYVFKYGDEFVIVLNDEGVPDLQLNDNYLKELDKTNSKDKEYLQSQMQEALWLIKSLHQRQRTLYKVLESIVRFQVDFFEKGVTQLKPLVLKEVAEDIEVHESTVSRITTNKYVSTPFGIFELKYFFNSGLGMDGGGQVASKSVKAAIKKMISNENPQQPLSDKQIVDLLNRELQVNIARRTVAKYREAMGIASSTKRKKIY